MSTVSTHLGIDLGGTNLKWSVLQRGDAAWRVLDRGHEPTPADRGAEGVVGAIRAVAVAAVERWPAVVSIGIGVPGLYDPVAGTTRFIVNIPGDWAGVPVAGPVADAVGRPTALINDARAFGLAELRLGAGRGARAMVGFVLGTGVGGVIAIDDHVYLGHDGTAGELGHQVIDPDGPPCGCGDHGCLEAFIRADRFAEACGAPTVEAAVAAARGGDAAALAGIARVGRYLGIGIANVIEILTPDVVVVGGGVAASADLLFPPVEAELRLRVRTTALDAVRLVTAELGPWAGAIGAALHGAEATGLAATGAMA